MPTIHLSIPESLYRELKEVAEMYDIQVTDLVKIFIRSNIKLARMGVLSPSSTDSSRKIEELEKRLEEMERVLNTRLELHETLIRTISKMLHKLEERFEGFAMELEDLRESIGFEKPIVEPEIIER
uniref:Uncharacterized protein n=1 Tax=Fervidicoccus fontis TaxID=683846 RepID=A0A7J3ZJC9_9CREN